MQGSPPAVVLAVKVCTLLRKLRHQFLVVVTCDAVDEEGHHSIADLLHVLLVRHVEDVFDGFDQFVVFETELVGLLLQICHLAPETLHDHLFNLRDRISLANEIAQLRDDALDCHVEGEDRSNFDEGATSFVEVVNTAVLALAHYYDDDIVVDGGAEKIH